MIYFAAVSCVVLWACLFVAAWRLDGSPRRDPVVLVDDISRWQAAEWLKTGVLPE